MGNVHYNIRYNNMILIWEISNVSNYVYNLFYTRAHNVTSCKSSVPNQFHGAYVVFNCTYKLYELHPVVLVISYH